MFLRSYTIALNGSYLSHEYPLHASPARAGTHVLSFCRIGLWDVNTQMGSAHQPKIAANDAFASDVGSSAFRNFPA